MDVKVISPKRLAEVRERGDCIDLVDVRTPAEFGAVHAEGARNVPLDRLDPTAVMQSCKGTGEQPLYVICRSGNRSRQACETFISAGYTNVYNVEGGTLAWDEAGLPVIRGKKAMSLERQVRIVAGFLVLVGAVLAVAVHPYFALVPAFVGAGLMHAGITDTCGMALVLAKMPWNNVTEQESPQVA